jgi:hypothetical protein
VYGIFSSGKKFFGGDKKKLYLPHERDKPEYTELVVAQT